MNANRIKLGEVLYVSCLIKNLFLVGSIAYDGYKLFLDSGQMHIFKGFDLADTYCIVAFGSKNYYNGFCVWDFPQEQCFNPSKSSCKLDELWHYRLDHLNPWHLEFMIHTGKIQQLSKPKVSNTYVKHVNVGKRVKNGNQKARHEEWRKHLIFYTQTCVAHFLSHLTQVQSKSKPLQMILLLQLRFFSQEKNGTPSKFRIFIHKSSIQKTYQNIEIWWGWKIYHKIINKYMHGKNMIYQNSASHNTPEWCG